MDTKPVSTNSALVAAETTPDNMFLFPTSFAQQRLWFLNQLTPGSPAYNISLTPRLKGVLDFVAFERSLEEIVRRHEILHTSFALENGQPVQVVAPARPLKVAVQDLRRLSESDREKEALRRMTEEALRPFDLSRGPLLRVLLLQLGAEEHILVLTMHHIVSDGWSVQVMLRELSTLYGAFREGRPSPLPSLSIQYADFAVWQRDWLKDGAVSDQLGYWKKQLLGAATLELPTNRARPAVHSFRGGWQALELSRELTEALRQLSQREGATLFMSLVAAFQALLHRYCQQDDISLGTPIANRNRVELEGLIGFFANTLVLRTDLSGDPSFRALLRRVRKVTVDAYKSQDVPFERLVEELQPDRDLSRNPLFQVSLALQSDPLGELVLPGLVVTSVWPQASTTKVDLEVYLFEVFGGIQGWFVYSSDLFDRETIARMVRAFGIILKGIAADPERPISELPLLDDTERQEILVQWNETACEFPEDQCIHHLFELQARSNSEATAAIFEDQRISYGELNRRANQVAHCLSQRGVGPDVLVGLCVERSLELLVGLLGILKAGGAYVPLDPSYPPERLSFMIDDSNARVLLTQRQAAASLPSHNADVVYLDADWESIAKQSVDNPDVRITSRNLAYVIYTSGSTGTPKGALIEHRGLRSVAEAQFRIFNLQPDSRVLQFASLSFDASIFEIVMAIRAGGTLCLARPESLLPGPALAELLRTRAITHVTLPPSALAAIPVEDLPTLRTITVAGEACPAELVAPWAKQRRFFNLYGPTEATIWATFAECFDSSRRPPIGRPIPGTQVYVLDQHRKPVPIGVTGELYIGGMGLARGYHNRPELTAEHFIRNPFSHHLDARLYKTGDRVRYLPDGNLEFLGRLDHQVKVRGFRIELREIEEWLRRHSDVRDCVVVLRENTSGEKRLVAYVAGDPNTSLVKLRSHLRQRLPEYMMPSAFVILDELPHTPNGKIDRKALPDSEKRPISASKTLAPPQNAVEQIITDIWKEALRVDRIGRDDNFFDLGGHSLLIAGIHSKLTASLGRELRIVDLFQYPTISALAEYLAPTETVQPTSRSARRRERRQQEPIAIIAMTGRFPGAKNVEELWRNLHDGVESIRRFSDEELEAAGVDPKVLKNPNYSKAGAVLEEAELFDAGFFGFSPREAELTDPQQRLFLECAHEALELAGFDPQQYRGPIGVYGGASMSSYLLSNLIPNGLLMPTASPFQTMTGNACGFLATKASYKLNLKGPAVDVQTACSTSLVAVHLACQSLLSRECDMALAGGVTISFPQKAGYHYEEEGILSFDGHCRAFDAKAQGTVAGNGVGIVVLKRLSDAFADGNTIHAVILASAINNDGSLKVGYTAPSVAGQSEVIAETQAMAGVTADTITYIEAHGTGTSLGDPIEMAALTQAFRLTSQGRQYCAVGSVKSNLGHLDAAAGVTGLIKTVLQLQHKQLVPSLHYEQANPKIDFANSPFYVSTKLEEWKVERGPRRAGVSSFGIGGTNAHMVMEEAPEREPSGASRRLQLLTISAKTSTALQAATVNLGEHLKRNEEEKLADVAYTQAVGRTGYRHRRVVVCETREEAQAALEGRAGQQVFSGVTEGERGVAFLFPGQGTQYVGMGRELYESEEVYRREVERCAEQLRGKLGVDLREVLYPQGGQDEKAREELKQTRLTQPALFAVEWGLSQLWRSWGVEPEGMAGHSVGEYVAATVAGVLELEEALEVVAERGRLMQGVEPGGMLSVPLEEEEVRGLVGEGLWIAAVNGPGLTVASGRLERIAELQERLRERGVEGRRLETSHAFHSGMMEVVLEEFRGVLQRVQLKAPRKRYLSNVTGTWIKEEEARDPNYWVRHLRETVRFGENVKELLGNGERVLLEVGPGNVLGGLARRHRAKEVYGSLRSAQEEGSDGERLVRSLGRLWVAGVKVDWEGYYGGEKRHRVELPTYPFERQRYCVAAGKSREGGRPSQEAGKKPNLADWFYRPSWERSVPTLSSRPGNVLGERSCWLVFVDKFGLGSELVKRLEQEGQETISVFAAEEFGRVGDGEYCVNPRRPDDYVTLLKELSTEAKTPDRIVHLWSVSANDPTRVGMEFAEKIQDLGFYSLLYMAQAVELGLESKALQIAVVSNNMQEVVEEEELYPEKATVLGLCKVIPQEYPHIRCRSIDLVLPSSGTSQEADLVDQLLSELVGDSSDTVIAYRGRHRWVQSFKPVALVSEDGYSPRLRERGVYLITGGLGGVGLELAQYLAETVQARLVLIGRSGLPLREEWEGWVATHDDEDDVSRKIRKVQALEELGAEVLVLRADVADKRQMQEVIARTRERFGDLHGAIHAAMIPGGILIRRMTREIAESVFAPKVKGTQILDLLLKGMNLDFFVLCSSQRSILGGPGQAGYCAANAFLDAFASTRSLKQKPFTVSIVWDAWKDVGISAGLDKQFGPGESQQDVLKNAMLNEEGVDAFRRILGSPLPVVVVSTEDFQVRLERYKALTVSQVLEEFERTRTPNSTHPRPQLRNLYVAPRNKIEQTLADIWQQLLGIEQVGIQDNFFELGGDSVISIQIIARARQAGLQLTPKQVFHHQTIAKLAAAGGTASVAEAEQGLVKGPLPLTPIQHWFFEQNFPDVHHWNQAVLLEVRQVLDPDPSLWERVVQQLLVHHDALRLRFIATDGGWQQVITGSDETGLFTRADFSALSEASLRPAIEAAASELQASLNLSEGPLLRAALFDCGTQRPARLLLIIHHLAIDIISWRILLEDLQTAWSQLSQGEPVQLPPKTTSFKYWAHRFTEHTRSGGFNEELAYWLAAPRRGVCRLPVDYPASNGANTEASAQSVSATLSVEETRALLQDVPQIYNTQINDALLTALVQAFAQWTGERTLLVDLEGLGREAILEDVDLSRTVGWFTPLYPVRLELEDASQPGEALKSIKEQLRRIPNRGIGYGALRYLSGDAETAEKLRTLPQAEVSFVYLGQSDALFSESAWLGPACESSGPTQSQRGQRSHLLSINGAVAEGCLRLNWVYSKHRYREDTIEKLAEGFMEGLRTLIAHCQSRDARSWTPSDVEEFNWSQSDIDSIAGAIDKSLGNV